MGERTAAAMASMKARGLYTGGAAPYGYRVDADGRLVPDEAEAAVKRAFVAAARKKVLLTDHTKYGIDHFAHVADLSEIDVIISDTALTDQAAADIADAGPKVVRA
mgnify:CR=1 FL=1